MQHTPPHWLSELDDILTLLSQESDDTRDEEVIARLTTLDPDLLAFLVAQFAEQESPQAAHVLEALTLRPDTPEPVREQAAAGLRMLAERGISPSTPDVERFVSGWIQQGRERGEQILMLCWRLAQGEYEAFVFLLDWRGDGLKDFYRTRRMKEEEWLQLVEHNRDKGVTLVEIRLGQALALLEASLAESRRFSRSLPRDYKLESSIIERRINQASEPTPELSTYISPSLTPDAVVSAYISALHYRDYLLVAMLLDQRHPLRGGHTIEETAEELRLQFKHAPRRERDAQVTIYSGAERDSDEAIVEAVGARIVVEKTGRRVRQPVSERYILRRDDSWRVVSVS